MKTQPIIYKLFSERTRDNQFYSLIKTVRNEGVWKMQNHHGERSLTYNGFQLKFKMENGFPLVTDRRITKKMFHGAIAELVGFLNGATTLAELMSFGMPKQIWADWVTKEKCAIFGLREGEIGPASYGGGWAHFPMPNGHTFNQIKETVALMKTEPFRRTFHITPWIPFWVNPPNRKVTVAPCHGWIFPTLFPERKELNLVHIQRSGDILVGVPLNFIHYGILGMMLAHELGYTFVQYDFFIADAHIYERQIEDADRILADAPPEGQQLGSVLITDKGLEKSFFALRHDDFERHEYYPNEKEYQSISTPV